MPASGNVDTDRFLAAHPEVLVGRAALSEAETAAGDDTFDIINKPLSNVVLVQTFHADTLERLFVVALVNDQKAEDDYRESHQDGGDEDDDEDVVRSCPFCGAGSTRKAVKGPERFLIKRMATCPKGCKGARVGRMWPA